MLLPLIVTNNPLYISNSSFNLKKISHLQSVKVQKTKWLILDAGQSNELKQYNQDQFGEKYRLILEEKKELYTGTKWGPSLSTAEKFKENIAKFEKIYMPLILNKLNEPRYVWVVNSDYLEEFLISFFHSMGANPKNKR